MSMTWSTGTKRWPRKSKRRQKKINALFDTAPIKEELGDIIGNAMNVEANIHRFIIANYETFCIVNLKRFKRKKINGQKKKMHNKRKK